MPVCVRMPPSPCPAGADAFDESALWHQLHLQFARHHLPLGLGVEPDVAHDRLAHQLGFDQLADSSARHRGVVGDHCEVAFVLAHDLVNDALGRTDGHEAADHQACAVGDHGDRLIEREGSHDAPVLARRKFSAANLVSRFRLVGAERPDRHGASLIRRQGAHGQLQTPRFVIQSDPAQLAYQFRPFHDDRSSIETTVFSRVCSMDVLPFLVHQPTRVSQRFTCFRSAIHGKAAA